MSSVCLKTPYSRASTAIRLALICANPHPNKVSPRAAIDECFGYDRQNRLVSQASLAGVTCNLSPSNPATITNSYYAIGNIQTKGSTSLSYEANTHRVSSASGQSAASYLYDANGQVTEKTSSSPSPSQTFSLSVNVSWTVFNQPESLTKTNGGNNGGNGNNGTINNTLSYTYGAG